MFKLLVGQEQFSGPLDLLLNLIKEQKFAITEVSLSQVTEQFIAYLNTVEETRPEELADFLVIAARLLWLKSRTLLPQSSEPEEDGPSLAEQLRLYQAFVEASKRLNRRWLSGRSAFFREEPPRRMTGFVAPKQLALAQLLETMVQLVNRLQPPKPLPETRIDRAVSLKEKIKQIVALLQKRRRATFVEVVGEAENRTAVIVSFLALLELVKKQLVALRQRQAFGDIVIEKT